MPAAGPPPHSEGREVAKEPRGDDRVRVAVQQLRLRGGKGAQL